MAPHTDDEADGDRRAHRARPARRRRRTPCSSASARSSTRSSAALTAAGIPVEVDTLGGFWTRPEILDVRAWLGLLADPGDNIALARILLGPAYQLSRRDLFCLADHAKGANREQRRERLGDRDILRYAIIDSIVAHDADRRALGRRARARRRASAGPGASWPRRRARLARRPRRRDRPRERARRGARGLARSRGRAGAPPPRQAARPRPGLPAGGRLGRPRRLRRATSTRSRSPTRTRTSCARSTRTPSG